jgi:hypothetical protein
MIEEIQFLQMIFIQMELIHTELLARGMASKIGCLGSGSLKRNYRIAVSKYRYANYSVAGAQKADRFS